MITVKVTKDDSYKERIREQCEDTLQCNIAIGFAEALKTWGYNNFEIMIG